METVTAFTLQAERPLRLHWVRVMPDGERLMPMAVGETIGADPLLYAGSMTPLDGMILTLTDGRSVRVATPAPTQWQGGFVALSKRIGELKAEGIWLPGFEGQRPTPNVPGSAPAVTTPGEARLLSAILGLDAKIERVLAILKP